jgi:hypothetical protein
MSERSPSRLGLAVAGLVTLIVALGLVWGWLSEDSTLEGASPAPERAAGPEPLPEPRPEPTPKPAPTKTPPLPSSTSEGQGARAGRDTIIRQKILAAYRDRAASPDARPTRGASDEDPPASESEGLRDRTEGGLDPALLEEFQTDFMPLVDECISAARERDPELAGMLAVGVTIVADAELGSIVESVEYPEDRNELADPELLECVEATALSMLLPPYDTGSDALMLTLPVSPEDGDTN